MFPLAHHDDKLASKIMPEIDLDDLQHNMLIVIKVTGQWRSSG
jgi:hypothetical protein